MLDVRMDWSALGSVLQHLQAPQLNRAVAVALSDTQRNAKTRAAQLIARRTGLKSSVVKDRIRVPYVNEATLEATIEASRKGISLTQFPSTRWVASGIYTRASGTPQTIHGGFLAMGQAFVRVGRERLPIRKLGGPTVYGMFVSQNLAPQIRARIVEQLPRNIARRVRSALRRYG